MKSGAAPLVVVVVRAAAAPVPTSGNASNIAMIQSRLMPV
jgi:hypothetical protein